MTMISGETASQEQEQESQEGTEQTSQQSDSTGLSESTDTSSEGGFDSESLEISFGLPPGSLKDVKDEASAVKAIKEHTDAALLAGLGDDGEQEQAQEETPAPAKPAQTKGKAHDTPDGEPSLLQRIAQLETKLDASEKRAQQQEKIAQKQVLAEIERRLVAEVDTWGSAKFGVSGSRNYDQTKEMRKMRDELLPHYLAGAKSLSVDVPSIEIAARRIRVHCDPDFKPSKRKADAGTSGTPGQRRESADSKAPRSIHDLVFNMK